MEEEHKKRLHIGTSGWSYRWKGLFYPEEMKSADYLPFYAGHFNCTEINSSFYHFTMAKTIEKWLAITPPDFMFAPKLNQNITHKQRLLDVEPLLEKFMNNYLLMGDRLGPILVQLPGSFKFEKKLMIDFYQLIRQKYPNQTFAMEVRNVSWHTEESLELMEEFDISFVIASSGKRFPYLEKVTTDTVYLRLHGDEKLYSSLYSDEKLERYAFMIQDWLLDGKDVWVFFNNTMFGSAIENAKTLKRMVVDL